MKYVKFTMYFEVAGYQTLPLPGDIDASDEEAVKEYIADNWDHIKLPKEFDYVGDNGFDFESPIKVYEG